MQRDSLLVRVILSLVCAGHVATGLTALISGKRALQIGSLFYRANFEPTKQFEVIARPLGAYMLSLAFLQGLAIRDPWRYKAVIDATLLVFVLRQIQRVIFARDVQSAFGILPRDHDRTTLYFRVIAALLLLGRLGLRGRPH